MTDSKPKKAQRRFSAYPYSLSDDHKSDLLALLSNDDGQAIVEVEQCLGLYIDGVEHMDKPPRPADFVKAFKLIQKDTKKLLDQLSEFSDYFYDEFEVNGADQNEIEAALAQLDHVANAVVSKYEKESSKGARKNNALAEVVRRLRIVFRKHDKGPKSGGRSVRGAFEFKAAEEKREEDFVTKSLLAARIIRPKYNLQRLFRDPRCALPVIAKKTDQLRKQKIDK